MPTYVLCPRLNCMYSRTRRRTVSSDVPGFGTRRNRQQAGGLVEDDDVLVFVKDVEGRAGARLGGPIEVEIDRGPCRHVEAGIPLDPAIDRDLSFFNGLADLSPGQIWRLGLQPFIEPHESGQAHDFQHLSHCNL